MRILNVFLLFSLITTYGCEGRRAINPTYQRVDSLVCQIEDPPNIQLLVQDMRAEKVFSRSPGFGETTDEGRGGPWRLLRPTKEIFEQAFSEALRACNYTIQESAQIIYNVTIEKFIVIVHPPKDPIFGVASDIESNVVVNIKITSANRYVASKLIIQKDFAKKLEVDTFEVLLSRSLSNAVGKALSDLKLANAIKEEHSRITQEWETAIRFNTSSAYRSFIEKYSKSAFSEQAKERIEDFKRADALRLELKTKAHFNPGLKIKISVDTDYERPEQPYLDFPIKSELVRKQYNSIKQDMEACGFNVIEDQLQQYDVSLALQFKATPLGQEYRIDGYGDYVFLYTGGKTEGTVTMRINSKAFSKDYGSTKPAGASVMIPSRNGAFRSINPFRASYGNKLCELLYSIWGPDPLLLALRSEESNSLKYSILKVLKDITGQDFGDDAAKWRQWLK